MSKLLITLLVVTHFQILLAQDRYFIYFDKKVSDNYPYSLDRPKEFLTQSALDRRRHQKIPLDSSDLPVNPAYIQMLERNNIAVFFPSKWLNGAIVQMSATASESIKKLPFVDSVTIIAENLRLIKGSKPIEYPTSFEPSKIFYQSTSDIQLNQLGVDRMHTDNVFGQEMKVAIFDNGFKAVNTSAAFQHLWGNRQIIATKDFVSNSGNVFQYGSHGTSVFSIIAGKVIQNLLTFTGVVPKANFVLCITEDDQSENRIEEYNWLVAAEFADSLGVDIINSSLGYLTFDIAEYNYDYNDLDGRTAIVSQAALMAAKKGIVVVVSAGNEGDNPLNEWRYVTPPADADSILAVGSVNSYWQRSLFSSLGGTKDGRIKPDVAAFGDATAIVQGDGNVFRGSGTSYSSPLIAGLAAGIWQVNADWTAQQVIEAVRNSGHKASAPDTLLGYGVPNYIYAVEEKFLNISDIIEDKVFLYPNPFKGDTLYIKTNKKLEDIDVKILNIQGELVIKKTFKKFEENESYEIILENIEQGLYYFNVQYDSVKKVVKLINL